MKNQGISYICALLEWNDARAGRRLGLGCHFARLLANLVGAANSRPEQRVQSLCGTWKIPRKRAASKAATPIPTRATVAAVVTVPLPPSPP
jgi:hypothetical protein